MLQGLAEKEIFSPRLLCSQGNQILSVVQTILTQLVLAFFIELIKQIAAIQRFK